MNKADKKKAVDLFHNAENNWNCAQAILKSRQENLNISDENIELHYRSKGGGRAENGICGALYAAVQMLEEEDAQEFISKAKEYFGAITCKKLKGELKIPCPQIVDYVDEMLYKEKIKNSI